MENLPEVVGKGGLCFPVSIPPLPPFLSAPIHAHPLPPPSVSPENKNSLLFGVIEENQECRKVITGGRFETKKTAKKTKKPPTEDNVVVDKAPPRTSSQKP